MPWVTSLDARLGVNYRLGKDSVITVSVEAFNVFNSQRPTAVDNNYTFDTVGPVIDATQGTVPPRRDTAGPAPAPTRHVDLTRLAMAACPRPFYANGAPAQSRCPIRSSRRRQPA